MGEYKVYCYLYPSRKSGVISEAKKWSCQESLGKEKKRKCWLFTISPYLQTYLR